MQIALSESREHSVDTAGSPEQSFELIAIHIVGAVEGPRFDSCNREIGNSLERGKSVTLELSWLWSLTSFEY